MELVIARPEGLYCPPGDFYIDPWRPVGRAVITHAHSDHARTGHGHYLAHHHSSGTLRTRLGDITLQTLEYNEPVTHNGVKISLHPAGHVLGSAQVRLEYGGEVWVASGDYKLENDGTCAPFEPVRCDTFITESTFGLPVYRWPTQPQLFADINAWWRANAAEGKTSVLFCYAFGKAQRILSGVDASIGPIVVHGAVEPLNAVYRAAGVPLPPTYRISDSAVNPPMLRQALVLAPPSAQSTPWMRRFNPYSDAFASGWMLLRGTRRRRGVDRGFVMSDHADWSSLLQAIGGTGAQRIMVTHGSIPVLVRWLTENGLDAQGFATEYGDEDNETPPVADASASADAKTNAGAGANTDTDTDTDTDANANPISSANITAHDNAVVAVHEAEPTARDLRQGEKIARQHLGKKSATAKKKSGPAE